MVTPEDLLDLAQAMHSMGTETAHRSAVSRAYYAAYHHLRVVVESRVGFVGTGTADDHALVIAAVQLFDGPAADWLRYLRFRRNQADYDLGAHFPASTSEQSLAIGARLLAIEP